MSDEPATIEIVAEPPPWLLFARWGKVSISIDDARARLRWGTHAFHVTPGTHQVAVGAGRQFDSRAVLEVTVAAGESVRLRYEPRLVKHLRGKLAIERLPPARVVKR